MSDAIITPEFRVSFPNVFRPGKSMNPNAEGKYGLTMLFAKDANLKPLKDAVAAILTDKFGERDKWPKNYRSPFRDQGEKDYQGYVEGCVFINATSKQRPGLVDARGQDIITESDFYAGCWAIAQVRPYWYDQSGNKGIGFGLQNVMKRRDDTPLDGRMKASEAFKDFATETASAGGDEDDPFNL